MSDNLFSALSKYTPRLGRTPEEDFLTEVFAWSLRKSPAVRSAFLQLVGTQPSPVGDPIPPKGAWEIRTQRVLPSGKRVDLVLDYPRKALFYVECKVEADIGLAPDTQGDWVSQLEHYKLDLQKEHKDYETTRLVFLSKYTGYDAASTKSADVRIRWRHIHQMLEREICGRADLPLNEHWIVTQLKEFLEEEGMGTPKPFSKQDCESLFRHSRASNQCKQFIERIICLTHEHGFTPEPDSKGGSQFRKGQLLVWGHNIQNEIIPRAYPCLLLDLTGEIHVALGLSVDGIQDEGIRARVKKIPIDRSPWGGHWLVRPVPTRFYECKDEEEQTEVLIGVYRHLISEIESCGAVPQKNVSSTTAKGEGTLHRR